MPLGAGADVDTGAGADEDATGSVLPGPNRAISSSGRSYWSSCRPLAAVASSESRGMWASNCMVVVMVVVVRVQIGEDMNEEVKRGVKRRPAMRNRVCLMLE